jgi:hypothetical protein
MFPTLPLAAISADSKTKRHGFPGSFGSFGVIRKVGANGTWAWSGGRV